MRRTAINPALSSKPPARVPRTAQRTRESTRIALTAAARQNAKGMMGVSVRHRDQGSAVHVVAELARLGHLVAEQLLRRH